MWLEIKGRYELGTGEAMKNWFLALSFESFPRSAMTSIQFPNATTRYDALRMYHD